MKAYVARGSGELAVVEVDLPDPVAGQGESLVQVHAASLNRGNLRGIRIAEPGTPIGWDVAGVTADGRRVAGVTLSGAFGREAVIPDAWLAPVPDEVSLTVAAALPIAFVTALQIIRDVVAVQEGDRVLVTGAAGGVGLAAVQLAKQRGAIVTGTVSDPEKVEIVRALGADHVLVGGHGAGPYDVVLDSIAGDSVKESIDVSAPWGTVVLFGSSSGGGVKFDPRALFGKSASVLGYSIFDSPSTSMIGRDLKHLLEMVAEGAISVHLWATKALEDLPGALEALESRRVVGKVVFET